MTKIENELQYRWALNRVEEILHIVKDDTPLTDPYSIELELLSGLVADYSDEYYSIGEPTLVDMLKLRMYEMGLTQVALLAAVIAASTSRSESKRMITVNSIVSR